MALNDINLTADNLEKIYGTVLLGSDDKVITENSNQTSNNNNNSKFLGSNLKSVVILVNQPAATILLDEELDFLTSILSACGYMLADVAIVNCATKKTEFFIPHVKVPLKNYLFSIDVPDGDWTLSFGIRGSRR